MKTVIDHALINVFSFVALLHDAQCSPNWIIAKELKNVCVS